MRLLKKLFLKIRLNKKIVLIAAAIFALIVIIALILILVFHNNQNPKEEAEKVQDAKALKDNFTLLFKEEVPNELEDKLYIAYQMDDNTLGKFKINIKIPMLKLKTNTAKDINSEITEIFAKKILAMVQGEGSLYTIYNINFFATENDNILTLAIKCTLKEGKNAQRTILKTYNYDLENDRILTLSEIIDRNRFDRDFVQKQIKSEIEKQIEKTEAIKEEGYKVYERAINDTIYLIENTEEFMLDKNGNLYIIYPYGNTHVTGEMDVVAIVKSK